MTNWLRAVTGGAPVTTYFKELPVWDVPRAEREVDQFYKLIAKYGPTVQIDSIVAVKNQDWDGPWAIATHQGESFVSFAIALNASNHKCFRSWVGKHKVIRWMWLLEAYFHTLEGHRRFEAGIPVEVGFEPSASPWPTLESIATQTRQIYRIKKRVDRVLRETSRDPMERPLGLSIAWEQAQQDLSHELAFDLDEAAKVARRMVEPILKRLTQDYLSAWTEVSKPVYRILADLASLAGIYDETGRWVQIERDFKAHPVFSRAFSQAWPALYEDWRESSKSDDGIDLIPSSAVATQLKDIFLHFGIRVLDQPVGMRLVDFVPPDCQPA